MKTINGIVIIFLLLFALFIPLVKKPNSTAGLIKIIDSNHVIVSDLTTKDTFTLDMTKDTYKYSSVDLKHLYKNRDYKEEYIQYTLSFVENENISQIGKLYALPIEGDSTGYLPPIRNNCFMILVIEHHFAFMKSDTYIVLGDQFLNDIMDQ